MAYTELTVQGTVSSGLEATYVTATLTDGNMFRNTGKEILHIINADASPITVTLVTPYTVAGLAVADETIVVTNGEERFIGHLDPTVYNQSGTDAGKVYVQYTSITSVTVAVIQ